MQSVSYNCVYKRSMPAKLAEHLLSGRTFFQHFTLLTCYSNTALQFYLGDFLLLLLVHSHVLFRLLLSTLHVLPSIHQFLLEISQLTIYQFLQFLDFPNIHRNLLIFSPLKLGETYETQFSRAIPHPNCTQLVDLQISNELNIVNHFISLIKTIFMWDIFEHKLIVLNVLNRNEIFRELVDEIDVYFDLG